MPIDPKYVNQIANGLTDNPDVFKENFGAVAKAGVNAAKKCASDPKCRDTALAAGKWAVDKGKKMLSKRKANKAAPAAAEEEEAVAESFTNCCRNKVYRRGTVMKCNRSCNSMYCESCAVAIEETRIRVLGLSENKREPSNKPDDLEVEDSFEVHDDYDEDKKEPGKPGKQKRKSSLQDGPEGEKGSKKSPYLKEARMGQFGDGPEVVTGHGRDPGPRMSDEHKLGEPFKKRPYDKSGDFDKPGSRAQCGKCDLGLKGQDAADHGLCLKCKNNSWGGPSFDTGPRGNLSRRKRGLH